MAIRSSIILLVLTIMSCGSEQKIDQDLGTGTDAPMFRSLDPVLTGINFINQIEPSADLSFSNYSSFNNGGGVATGDLDNDGFVDVFLVSNQGANQIYKNLGNLKFENKTPTAGIESGSNWKTGVTMADVNGDGLLDIYVSCTSGFSNTKGKNALYVNKGDFKFKEEASQYGLDFSGFGVQAAFFDFDHDHDLDCFLLTNAGHDANTFQSLKAKLKTNPEGGDRLLENRNGRFIDVSIEAGITQSFNGFGLGVAVADFNDDGWEDIYVSNDFHEDDFFYINQKNGRFKESLREYFGHCSRFSMGSDAADYNNDGYIDLVTLDMYPPDEQTEKSTVGEDPNIIQYYKRTFGYYAQVSRNCLQMNLGGQHFVDVANFAGVAATDWSWSALFADFDRDGQKDLVISNGVLHRPNDLDFLDFYYDAMRKESQQDSSNIVPTKPGFEDYAKLPNGLVGNYFFGGRDGKFQDLSKEVGWTKGDVSTGMSYADLDNDGDLDLVSNRLNSPSNVIENLASDMGENSYLSVRLEGLDKNTFGVGTKVYCYLEEQMQLLQMMPTRGFISSVDPKLYFGFQGRIDQIDSLKVVWTTGEEQILPNVSINRTLALYESDAELPSSTVIADYNVLLTPQTNKSAIQFRHVEDDFIDFSRDAITPFRMSLEGPALACADINRDGLDDVFIGGARNQPAELWMQNASGLFQKARQSAFVVDSAYEDVDAVFFDADNDHDLDLYVVSGGNEYTFQEDRLYINNGGKGTFIKGRLPEIKGNKSCVAAADFDRDGDLDLFVGGRNIAGAYGDIPRSYLLISDGVGNYSHASDDTAPGLSRLGMVTAVEWADIDNDEDLDLIVVGEWMPLTIFENQEGKLIKKQEITTASTAGLWQSLAVADLDNDGDLDLVAGNFGLNAKVLKDQGARLRLYVNDFDGNAKVEQILAYNRGDDWYPAIIKKSELDKVIPNITRKRFQKNIDFAGKTMENIFNETELKSTRILEVDQLASMYFENLGNHKFQGHILPEHVQYSSIYAILTKDINGDNMLDLIVGGNSIGSDSYQGPHDASYGWTLLGDGHGSFSVVFPMASGFNVTGQIRAIRSVKINDGSDLVLVARNDDDLLSFKSAN